MELDLSGGVGGLAAEVSGMADQVRQRVAAIRNNAPQTWKGAAAQAEQQRRLGLVGSLSRTATELDDLADELRRHAATAQANYDAVVAALQTAAANVGQEVLEGAQWVGDEVQLGVDALSRGLDGVSVGAGGITFGPGGISR